MWHTCYRIICPEVWGHVRTNTTPKGRSTRSSICCNSSLYNIGINSFSLSWSGDVSAEERLEVIVYEDLPKVKYEVFIIYSLPLLLIAHSLHVWLVPAKLAALSVLPFNCQSSQSTAIFPNEPPKGWLYVPPCPACALSVHTRIEDEVGLQTWFLGIAQHLCFNIYDLGIKMCYVF